MSAVLNTYNAASTLGWALDSLTPWVDEIVVVDMHSTDGTQALAESRGARVYPHENVGYADPARAYAVGLARHEWVIVLDADEVVPADLVRVLRKVMRENLYDVVVIPWRNYLFGEPAVHGTWGPAADRHARFFRNGSVVYGSEVHRFEHPGQGQRVLRLPSDGPVVEHFNYADVSEFLTRTDRYSSIEAADLAAAGTRPSAGALLRDTGWRFLRSYIRNQGWKDGQAGLSQALLLATYRVVVHAKHQQLTRHGDREAVFASYRKRAQELVSGHPPRTDPGHSQ